MKQRILLLSVLVLLVMAGMAQTEKSRDAKAANREHYEAKKLINTWRLSKKVKYLVVFVSKTCRYRQKVVYLWRELA